MSSTLILLIFSTHSLNRWTRVKKEWKEFHLLWRNSPRILNSEANWAVPPPSCHGAGHCPWPGRWLWLCTVESSLATLIPEYQTWKLSLTPSSRVYLWHSCHNSAESGGRDCSSQCDYPCAGILPPTHLPGAAPPGEENSPPCYMPLNPGGKKN